MLLFGALTSVVAWAGIVAVLRAVVVRGMR